MPSPVWVERRGGGLVRPAAKTTSEEKGAVQGTEVSLRSTPGQGFQPSGEGGLDISYV